MKLFFLIFLFCIIQILTFTSFDKTEVSNCMSIVPISPTDCKNNEFITLVCCYFTMTSPDTGSVCVPMSDASKNKGGNVNRMFPYNLNITGTYDCYTNSSHYINSFKIFFILFIFIM